MKVEVYYNLHKNCLSVREKSNGRIFTHSTGILISKPKFVVQPAGRKRVLDEKKKNVHAFVRGNWSGETSDILMHIGKLKLKPVIVTYNPYKFRSFMAKGLYNRNLKPIYEARYAMVCDKHIVAWV